MPASATAGASTGAPAGTAPGQAAGEAAAAAGQQTAVPPSTQFSAQPAQQPAEAPDRAIALGRALAAAQTAREARSNLLAAVSNGEGGTPAELAELLRADPLAAKTKVLAVCEAVQGNRKIDVRRALDAADIAHATPVGQVLDTATDEQRTTLANTLSGLQHPQPAAETTS